MITVAEARGRLLASLAPLGPEQIPVGEAFGRVLAENVTARRTQPPAPLSAMDGYAVRAADVAQVPRRLKIVGAVPAGKSYDGKLGAGEAVRIFTGAPLPAGADAVVIQEDTDRDADTVIVKEFESRRPACPRAGSRLPRRRIATQDRPRDDGSRRGIGRSHEPAMATGLPAGTGRHSADR